jgi:hypothetical protein
VIRPFRIETAASAGREDAAVWYQSRRSGLGVEFLKAVDVTLDRIALNALNSGLFLQALARVANQSELSRR